MTDPASHSQTGRNVIYVVAKAPRAGQSKTRLCPPLEPEQSATLAAAFLRDTVALACESGADVRLLCRDEAEREALLPFTETGNVRGVPVTVHVQDGIGLGAALESAFVRGLADGYGAAGVLGMDTPALDPGIVREAFGCLSSDDEVAFGPSDDGGYYLLTARRTHPTLFRDMVWSTDQVGRETIERCEALGLRVHQLPQAGDVDDAASLAALCHALEGIPETVAPHTRRALAEMGVTAASLATGAGVTKA
jgi:uncharacterized protein